MMQLLLTCRPHSEQPLSAVLATPFGDFCVPGRMEVRKVHKNFELLFVSPSDQ